MTPHTATITLSEVGEIELLMTDEAILSSSHTVRIDNEGRIFWVESRLPFTYSTITVCSLDQLAHRDLVRVS